LGCAQRQVRQTEHEHGLDEPDVEFLARAMVRKPVSGQIHLAEEITSDLGLGPEMIQTQCEKSQADINQLNSEERAALTLE
jgi:hypothetical protein